MKFAVFSGFAAIAIVAMAGCNTTPTQEGAVLGGLLGAGAGAIIGNQSGHAGEGALIGAGAGALGGAIIGDQADERNVRIGPERRAKNYSGERGHWETVTVTTQSGETFEERRWIVDR